MEIDKIKGYWKEEDARISENVRFNRQVSFRKFRSSFHRIRIWRFVRIAQWFVFMPLLLVWGILPHMKNDGSVLFYVAFAALMVIMLSFCISYIYHYICLSRIDMTGSISDVQQQVARLEKLDKWIYLFRFVFLGGAFLCAYKLFGSPSFGPGKITELALIGFILLYTLIVRVKFRIPKEYAPVKSSLDQAERETKED